MFCVRIQVAQILSGGFRIITEYKVSVLGNDIKEWVVFSQIAHIQLVKDLRFQINDYCADKTVF